MIGLADFIVVESLPGESKLSCRSVWKAKSVIGVYDSDMGG